MKFIKSSLAICAIGVIVMVHVSHAQNSPQDYIKAHNAARAEVGVVPMSWNVTLATDAQKLTDHRISDCNLKQDLFGENIAMASYPLTGVEAVRLWANEKRYYDYDKNECLGRNCDHYLLAVWNTTVTVGCARAQCRNGFWFVSCIYYPQGRWPLQRPYLQH